MRELWEATDETPDDDDLDFCVDCGDTFRYDDCGGYNPPCVCGAHCRRCHELAQRDDEPCDDKDDSDAR